MGVKILIIATSHDKLGSTGKQTGWYLPEVAHPYYIFKAAGYEMTVASPKGGKAPMDEGSAVAFKDDPICQKFLADAEAVAAYNNSKLLSSLNPKNYQAVFYPGGHGPMFDLPGCVESNAAATKIYEAGGIVAAVCHGPAGIVDTKLSNGEYLVKGKKVACFTNKEEDAVQLSAVMPFMLETRLREHGADFVEADLWAPNVQVSDRVITGQNPASATGTAEAIVKALS